LIVSGVRKQVIPKSPGFFRLFGFVLYKWACLKGCGVGKDRPWRTSKNEHRHLISFIIGRMPKRLDILGIIYKSKLYKTYTKGKIIFFFTKGLRKRQAKGAEKVFKNEKRG